MNYTDDNRFIAACDIAEIMGVAISTVRGWQQRKQMPAPDIQSKKFTRWKLKTIKPFLDNPQQWRILHQKN